MKYQLPFRYQPNQWERIFRREVFSQCSFAKWFEKRHVIGMNANWPKFVPKSGDYCPKWWVSRHLQRNWPHFPSIRRPQLVVYRLPRLLILIFPKVDRKPEKKKFREIKLNFSNCVDMIPKQFWPTANDYFAVLGHELSLVVVNLSARVIWGYLEKKIRTSCKDYCHYLKKTLLQICNKRNVII